MFTPKSEWSKFPPEENEKEEINSELSRRKGMITSRGSQNRKEIVPKWALSKGNLFFDKDKYKR